MSTDHIARLNLIRANFAAFLAALPTPAANRVVTRSWKTDHAPDELKAGVYTLIYQYEGGYPNYSGGKAMDGFMKILLIGRILMPEKTTGEEIEDAEVAMFDQEVAPWLRALPIDLCCLEVKEFALSGQVQRPYGQVFFALEECAS